MRRLGCVTRNCRQGPMPAEASLFSLAHLYTPQVPLPVLISHLHLFLIFSSHDPHGPHSCWLMTTLQMSPVYQIHNWGLSHIKQETGSFILLLHRMGLSIFTFLSDYAQVLMYVCMHACMWRQRTVLGGHSSGTFFLDFGYKVSHWDQKLADQARLTGQWARGIFLPLHPQRWDYRCVLPCLDFSMVWHFNSGSYACTANTLRKEASPSLVSYKCI